MTCDNNIFMFNSLRRFYATGHGSRVTGKAFFFMFVTSLYPVWLIGGGTAGCGSRAEGQAAKIREFRQLTRIQPHPQRFARRARSRQRAKTQITGFFNAEAQRRRDSRSVLECGDMSPLSARKSPAESQSGVIAAAVQNLAAVRQFMKNVCVILHFCILPSAFCLFICHPSRIRTHHYF